MSLARRILLVATDHRFGQLVQTHLHKTFLLTCPVIRFEDLPLVVTPETDGILLFLASETDDAERIETATRELRLQQLPAIVAIMENDEFHAPRRTEHQAPATIEKWSWKTQIKDFNAWLKRNLTEGSPFCDPATETTLDRIRRKLLALTPSLTHMVEQLDIAAAHEVTVLIEGETGTGKTHLAKLIHECSARATERFLVVACGTLSGNLIASEFFGHVKGAFTGADTTKIGKFAAAGRGTLLLDEIDTLGLEHQANLLRVIESGEYEPVGSNETKICDARIIAATNWNLAEAVERGTFRRDLYYRLHVITFHLPPLRDRVQDISPLVRGMVSRYAAKFFKKIEEIQPEAMRALESFQWPGNIRQLENVVQQAVLTCSGTVLTVANLSPIVKVRAATPVESHATHHTSSLVQNRETTERAVIVRALEKSAFSRTRASQLLGVSRVTLYKKMKKYGLLNRGPTSLPPSDTNTPQPFTFR